MTEVYVLERLIDFGGGQAIGVYSTRELAEYAREAYRKQASIADDYDITPFTIDAPADIPRCHSDPNSRT